jgi:hypothetical protein
MLDKDLTKNGSETFRPAAPNIFIRLSSTLQRPKGQQTRLQKTLLHHSFRLAKTIAGSDSNKPEAIELTSRVVSVGVDSELLPKKKIHEHKN